MNQRLSAAVLGFVLSSMFVLAIAQGTYAATTSLAPGASYTTTIQATQLDIINFTWSTSPSTPVKVVVKQPDGNVIRNETMNYGDSFVIASATGTYTFTWDNVGTTQTTLTYDVSLFTSGFQPVEQALDLILIVFVVIAVAVVVVIVLVILVIMRGDKAHSQQPVYSHPGAQIPPGESPAPFVPGMCPRCGSHIDSKHVFCPKCGARVR